MGFALSRLKRNREEMLAHELVDRQEETRYTVKMAEWLKVLGYYTAGSCPDVEK